MDYHPFELYHDPLENLPYLFTYKSEVDWKGTPGVGDILFGLNSVHMMVHMIRKRRPLAQMTMNVHWNHSKEYLHHFEDPETIAERAEYLHNFYHDKDAVRMNHIFDSKDEEIQEIRHRGLQRVEGPTVVLHGLPSWMFRKDAWSTQQQNNKVVFWRPLFNKDAPRGWKRTFGTTEWEKIIRILEKKGFELTELTYRTPVSEALYHIRTCRFCIFYQGMWHYIAKNLCKPTIVLGHNPILKVHDPQAIHFYRPEDKSNDLFKYLDKLPEILEHMDRRANSYKNFILGELNVKD